MSQNTKQNSQMKLNACDKSEIFSGFLKIRQKKKKKHMQLNVQPSNVHNKNIPGVYDAEDR